MEEKIYYFILSGDHEELSLAELKALLEIIKPSAEIMEYYPMICLVKNIDDIDAEKVIRRAGYIKETGKLLGIDNPYHPELNYLDKVSELNTKYVKVSIMKSTIENEIADKYRNLLVSKTNLKDYYMKSKHIHLVFSSGRVFVGYPLFFLETRNFYHRRPSTRPFFRSIALPVRLSRLLINLARVKEGEVLLDPFAGTGSILIEALMMKIRPIGIEIDWKLIHGARENLLHYGFDNWVLILGDSTNIKLSGIDGIATDPPYGRAASTHGLGAEYIYSKFIENSAESLKNKRYLVFMAPYDLSKYIDEVLCSNGFIIRGKHYMFVHGGLTRVIYEALLV
ncbi:DNA methyltransferase [Staphylothermus hellenicus]|uniref:tRNA (guanine(10)-N(2))-dimethyltransferase n=1 Tax=Staphylothermus hellenicus (strain DSM 12710 / JCM 10830 / BK20S6-10-b1 / P8) TaxID=591019 RepID=D7D971_STAHD|nr:DNA methyltransferase [Staphylothermus hellenicus]ADI32317.1 putative RNA methylase [Staphylothermus hellenicus DSM 12710]